MSGDRSASLEDSDSEVHRVVECARSGIALPWSVASPPLLDMLEKAGLNPPYSCRYGSCHGCVADIISGEALHPLEVMSPGANKLLLCCAAPGSERLVIDI